jgi:protein SCO1/2
MKRGLAWIAALTALVAALAVGAAVWLRRPDPAVARSVATGPQIGGPFHLIDQAGRPVDASLLKGKWTAVFFGYTYCPDVCPTTLVALGRIADALGPDRNRFQVVFITVDPARDTPQTLARYLTTASFPKGVIGLTGAPSQVAEAARVYHVFYQKVPQGASYVMDHTAVIYLMNPQGRFVAPLDATAPPNQAATQLKALMERS